MRMVDLIYKKRSKQPLSKEEINFIVDGYTIGEIPDYQMSAFLMSIYFNGMNNQEISNLTMAMVNSGDIIDLSQIRGIKVDKHSTGGVGDKISLIVAPIVAYLGIPVAKMSGRGLGHTGGTIDKLESIQGFNINLSKEKFIENVNKVKIAIVGQTGNLAPADKKIYALRDVTATVDSIPLIASSIMSKKIASGADAIVLDVKVGTGAFMKTVNDAKLLSETMVEIGKSFGRRTIAIITEMNQPLGREVGNANEIRESIEVLKGNGGSDITEVATVIASYMSILGGVYENYDKAYGEIQGIISKGKALNTFKDFIYSQGGNPEIVDNPDLLPHSKYSIDIKSTGSGFISSIDTESIGIAAMLLGAGRVKKEDQIDHSVGITLNKKVGDNVGIDDVICTIHTNKVNNDDTVQLINKSYRFTDNKPNINPLIYDVIR